VTKNLGGVGAIDRSGGVAGMAAAGAWESAVFDGVLGELARPALLVPPSTLAIAVQDLFRRDEALRWVVMDGPGGPVLVERAWFESEMTGRLGFGRLLHARSRLDQMRHEPTLVLPAETPVALAAAAAVERHDPGAAFDGVVVSGSTGIGVASVTSIFERLARHYAHQSLHDPLTGLPNRLYLMERLRQRDGRHTVLLYADLDRFKDVNDLYGHAAGDQVLTQFADRMRSISRQDDLVARLGGDEFAVLTRTPMTILQSTALAERLVMEASAPFVVTSIAEDGTREHLVSIGASVGVARSDRYEAPLLLTSLDVLLKQADLAMYRAKSHGRGRVEHYQLDMLQHTEASEATVARRIMERRLRAAIAGGGLHLHYQPVVDLPDGRVRGVEALARWNDEELGLVPPDQFIPLAETTGLILDLGRWVLNEACRQAAAWAAGAATAPTVAVNVSPVQLRQASFIGDVRAALAVSGLGPEKLCLEITETAAVTDVTETANLLRQLRGLGVRLALDDFGTGHSSLTLLRRLPVHLIKIDRSFVERVATDAGDAVMVRLVVDAAHSLGLRVCAEGIEEPGQAQQLVAMGCDSAQGWLFGRPGPADELDALWRLPAPRVQAFDPDQALPVALSGSHDLVVTTSPDLVVTYISASCRQILGWMPSQIVGTSLDQLVGSSHVEGTTTLRVQHQDGTDRWLRGTVQRLFDEQGRLEEMLGVFSDVSDIVVRERALTASEELFRHAFSKAPVGMALSDLNGRFLRVNGALAQLLGRTIDELVTMQVADITHRDDRDADEINLASARSEAADTLRVRKRYLHADGHDIPVEVHAGTVPSIDGEAAYIVAHVLPQPPRTDHSPTSIPKSEGSQ